MPESLRILILEDNPADAELIQFELEEAGFAFTPKVVTAGDDFVRELTAFSPDLILSDYDLPHYTGALALAAARRSRPDTPFILVTGAVTEDRAIEILTQGAKDYVLKTRLQQRLGPAVHRALAEAEEHRARKQAEEELKAASLYSRTLLETSLDPLITISPEGKVMDVNKATEEITGISRERIIGSDFSDYFTEPEKARAGYKKVFSEGSVKDYPLAIRHATGRVTDVLYNLTTYKDEKGEVQGVFATARDVTDLKKQERELSEAHSTLEKRVEDRTAELQKEIEHRIRIEESQRKYGERLEILSYTAGRLLDSDDPQGLVEELCLKVMEFLDCHAFFNFLVDKAAGCLHLNAYAGIPAEKAREIEWLDYGIAVCGCAARDACRIVAEDIPTTPDVRTELVKSFGIKAYACHPLKEKNEVLGTLSFGTRSRTTFSDDDLAVMKAVADQVAISMARVRMEKDLRESEERYRELVHSSPDAVIVHRDGRFLFANPVALNMYGAESFEQLRGRTVIDLIHPDERAAIATRMGEGKAGLKVPLKETRIVRFDGRVVPVESVGGPVNYDGKPAVQISFRDITERKQAEEALQDSEKRYRRLFEASKDGILILHADTGKVVDVNPFLVQLLDYPYDELCGQHIWELGVFKDIAASRDAFKTLQDNEYIRYDDLPLETRDGRSIAVEFVSNVYSIDHHKVIQCNIRDITEHKKTGDALRESEERFRVAQELSPDGFAILRPVRDSEGRIVDFTFVYENAAIARINGTDPAAVVGRRLSEFLPAHSQSPFHEAHAHVADTGETCIMERKYNGGDIPRPTWFRVVVVRTGQDIAILSQDITERKQAEEALRESETRFRTMANSIPQLAWIARADGFIFWYNQRWYDYTGTTPGQMEGWGWQSVHDPKVLPEVTERWKTAIATGEPFDMEFPLLGADKVFRPFLTRVLPLRNEQGSVIQWFGTNTDLSERKRAEEALALNEREFRLLAESMPQIVWTTRPDGWNTYFNQKWVDYTGLTLEESYGHGWNKPFHPDDRQRAWDAWQDAVLYNAPYLLQCRLRRADGVYRWWLIHGVPVLDENGNIIKWYGTCTDIDDLKQTEEALRTVTERFDVAQRAAKVGIWDWDVVASHIEWSPQMFDLLGLDSLKNTASLEVWKSILHPEDVELASSRIDQALKQRTGLDSDYRIVLPNGRIRWINALGEGKYNDQGQPIRMIGIILDITERKQAEEAVSRSQKTFSELVERSPFGTYIVDSDFRIAQMNAASQTGAFKNVRPIIGRDFTEAMRTLWPEPVAAEIIAAFRHTLDTGEPYYSPRFVNPRHDEEIIESYEWELHRMTLPDGQYGVVCYYFDSTRLRDAEAALRASEERFRSYYELGLIGMAIASPDKGMVEVNDKLCEMLGYDRSELLRLTWAGITHPDDLAADIALFNQILAGEIDGYSLDKRFIRKDGAVIDAIISVKCIRTGGGSIDYIVALVQDITKRKRAEDRLRENQALLRAIIDGTTDPVYVKDCESRILIANDALAKVVGKPLEEIIGRTDAEQYGNAAVGQILREHDLGIMASGRSETMEETVPTIDGSRVFISNKAPLRNASGDIIGIIGISRDITERKRMEEDLRKSEEESRLLIKYAPSMIYEIDFQGPRFISVNDAMCSILGYTREELLSKNPLDFLESESREIFQDRMRKQLAGEKLSELVEYAGRAKDGRLLYYLLNSSFIYKDGKPAGAVVIAHDITERKQAEEELKRLNRTLQAISDSSQAMLRAATEKEYLEEVCRIVVEDCGYAMVWIGYAEGDEDKTVRPVAHAGFEEGYLETLNVTWADTERGRGPTGTTIRTGLPSTCRNMLTDPLFAPWREQAIKRGYASSIVFPLLAAGIAFGAITIYSREPDPFSTDEVKLLDELADDLAYGITIIRIRAAHEQAKESLKESEERYHSLFRAMTEGFAIHEIITDEKGTPVDYRFLDINPAFERLTGLKRADVVGRTLNEVLPGDDPKWLQMYGRVALTGEPVQFENYSPALKRHYEVFAYRPAPRQFAVIFLDITARKQAEEELKRQADKLTAMMALAPVGIAIAEDPSCRRIRMNEANARMLGLSMQDNASLNAPEEEKPGYSVFFEGRELLPEELPMQIAARGTPIRDMECEIRRADGSTAFMLCSATPLLDENGKPSGAIGSFLDLTGRKQAEEVSEIVLKRFFAVLSSMHSAILLVGNDGRVEFANQSFCDYFALREPPADLAGLSSPEMIEKIKNGYLEPDSAIVRIREIVGLGQPVLGEEVAMQGGRTCLRDFLPVAIDGVSYGRVWHHFDITKRKGAEEALEEVNRELESFSYSVSHDLRAPLRAIDGYARIIHKNKGDTFDADTSRKFNEIRANAQRMGQLIDDLLTFSRLGREQMTLTKIDMEQLVRDIWKEIEAANPNRTVKLSVNGVPPGYGDKALVRQVLFNLLANAFKFTEPRPEAAIEVGGEISSHEAVYYIRDNGVGFDMQYYDKLFGVFQRLHAVEDFEGTGVGLATVQRIIHKHGGRVWAEGKVDEGAAFYFTLPGKEAEG